jgi:hypothetical protein
VTDRNGWALINRLPNGDVQASYCGGPVMIIPREKWQRWLDEAWREAYRRIMGCEP